MSTVVDEDLAHGTRLQLAVRILMHTAGELRQALSPQAPAGQAGTWAAKEGAWYDSLVHLVMLTPCAVCRAWPGENCRGRLTFRRLVWSGQHKETDLNCHSTRWRAARATYVAAGGHLADFDV